ncbi:MAG: hypothetical protein A2983_01040 [Candidatus Magasanikbacteria bacterium RIFCSPLOWO2_01_FULL_40_15]|uniref:Uncharacterized protein n=1 Tax=Candidatus Magasanikbacteria bacterium RIFCSPLOWO2_01_FULL_40_15 TaxID=1798686 RepID=A0A1F6N3P4_9BACT|nr:MAG: hypothetical protein A3C66_01310 [Candidatus Magasanikbacteria bacterium RIFCSPHIGHO2_02_FULL_41_35]OGH78330.1 MAG: hypothetical protein A2983_01040 [Candidatus Magasanikbacteria bacterium RIFCSPLOWO2_01_FULL_40_15]
MVKKISIRKIVSILSVAIFLFLFIPQTVHTSGSCIFDPSLEANISSYCQNNKIKDARAIAISKATDAGFCSWDGTNWDAQCFGNFDKCEQNIGLESDKLNSGASAKLDSGCFELDGDPGYNLIYQNCYAGDCESKSTVKRYFCGWERMSEKMCNNQTEECIKNWSSCYFKQNDDAPYKGQCLLAKDTAETICKSILDPDKCKNGQSAGYNEKYHGCKWEETVRNGCYCVSNESATAGKTDDYVKETNYTKTATNNNSVVCVDLPFSRSNEFYKCAWYEDDEKKGEGARTGLIPGTANNGCWCEEFTDKGVTDPIDFNGAGKKFIFNQEFYYNIFDQKACDSWIFSSPSELNLQFCHWKENGAIISTTEKKSNDAKNGCYCGKDTADINNLDKGWSKDTVIEGQQKDTCLNIKAIVAGSWQQCVWIENDEIIEHATAEGKEGCYCNTVKDPNLEFVPTLTQSEQKCLDAPAKEHRPKCEWWVKNKMDKFKESKDASGDALKPVSEYKGIPFTIPSVEELNKIGTSDVSILIARVIKTLMGILGSISLVMFVYSGILYMTDMGNSERAGKAKQIFIWNSLGLVIIFASYAIVKMVFEAFG